MQNEPASNPNLTSFFQKLIRRRKPNFEVRIIKREKEREREREADISHQRLFCLEESDAGFPKDGKKKGKYINNRGKVFSVIFSAPEKIERESIISGMN